MLRYIDRHHLFGQSEPIARHHKVQQAFSAVIWTVLGSIISLNTWTPVLAQDKVNFDSDLTQQNSTTVSGEVNDQTDAPAVEVRLSILSSFLGQLSGGDNLPNFPYGGAVNLFLLFDGEKMGLWEGLSLDLHYVETFGDSPSSNDSAILPVNTAFEIPRLGGEVRDLSAVLRQRFPNGVMVALGKYNLSDLLATAPIIGGGGIDTFMNVGLAGRPTTLQPVIFLGGQISAPVGGGNFNLFVYDPETAQGSDYTPFENGVTFNGRYTLPITINGQRGFQSIGAVYSTKEGSDLKSAPILGELPPGVSTVIKGRGAWLVTYAFQQFLYQDPHNPAQNWGIFGDFIVTDGNPSPIKWRALVGIAGTAESPGRGLDRWGIGYFHYGFSNALAKNLASQGLRIRDENGVELFYNFAIAPQFRLKTDLQIVNPVFSAADLAVYGGVQVELKF